MSAKPFGTGAASGIEPGLQEVAGKSLGPCRGDEIQNRPIIRRHGETVGSGVFQNESFNHGICRLAGGTMDDLNAAITLLIARRPGTTIENKDDALIGVVRPIG